MINNIALIMTCHGINRDVRSSLHSVNSFIKYVKKKHSISTRLYIVDSKPSEKGYKFLSEEFDMFELIIKSSNSYWARSVSSALARISECKGKVIIHINSDLILDMSAKSRFLSAFDNYLTNNTYHERIIGFSYRDMSTNSLISGGPNKCLFSIKSKNDKKECIDKNKVNFRKSATVNGNFVIIPSSMANKVHKVFSNFRHSYADTAIGCLETNNGNQCMTTDEHAGWQYNLGRKRIYSIYFIGILCRDVAKNLDKSCLLRFIHIMRNMPDTLFGPKGIDLYYLIKLGWLTRRYIGLGLVGLLVARYIWKTFIFIFNPKKYIKSL